MSSKMKVYVAYFDHDSDTRDAVGVYTSIEQLKEFRGDVHGYYEFELDSPPDIDASGVSVE